jgi:hypothetical protein
MWLQCYSPQTKVDPYYGSIPPAEDLKAAVSPGKVMATILWGIHRIILIDFKPCAAVLTAFTYQVMLHALRKHCHVGGLACFHEISCYCIIVLDKYTAETIVTA